MNLSIVFFCAQRLALGADLVVHSATKYLGGHADALGGVLCGRRDLVERVFHYREIAGAALHPTAAFLLVRGLKTLELRISRQNESALQIARFLEFHDKVDGVFYPGLESHPHHDVARRQMSHFGGMLSFSLRGGYESVRTLLPRLRFARMAANLGSVATLAGPPSTTSHVELTVEQRRALGIPESLIRYSVGVDNHTLVWKEDKSPCLEPIKRAAKRLEQIGCRAIAAECGYFAYFQKDIAGYVDIPVFMSSLLQVPFIQQVIGPQKTVGIVCAQKRFLTDTHLQNVGIDLDSNFVVAGALDEYDCPEFTNLWDPEKRPERPESYYDQAAADMMRVCSEFCGAHENIGALMLECTGMQPFARAVQRVVDMPVFSWGTLLDYAYSVVAHRDYYGHV